MDSFYATASITSVPDEITIPVDLENGGNGNGAYCIIA